MGQCLEIQMQQKELPPLDPDNIFQITATTSMTSNICKLCEVFPTYPICECLLSPRDKNLVIRFERVRFIIARKAIANAMFHVFDTTYGAWMSEFSANRKRITSLPFEPDIRAKLNLILNAHDKAKHKNTDDLFSWESILPKSLIDDQPEIEGGEIRTKDIEGGL